MFAVVDGFSKTLDVYNKNFDYQHRAKIWFEPFTQNAISSVGDFIIIACAKSDKLYLQNWNGDVMTTVQTNGTIIKGIGHGGQEGRFQVCTYDGKDYHLHVYCLNQTQALDF